LSRFDTHDAPAYSPRMSSPRTRARSRMLPVREAAEILGVSRQMLYRLVWDGELPAVKISPRAIRIDERDLRAFAKDWNPPGSLGAEEVAEILGVSKRTVARYAESGELPAERHRGRLRFRERDVDRFVSKRRTRAR